MNKQRKQMQKINDTKSWLFENVNEIDKPLAKLIIKEKWQGQREEFKSGPKMAEE